MPVKGTVWSGAPVGQWVRDQRKAYRRGALTPERVESLEEIAGWVWSPGISDFEVGFEAFVAYIAEQQTRWVPVRFVCADGFA